MGGHHDEPMAVRKNVYVESLANYRDNLTKHFRFNRRTLPNELSTYICPACKNICTCASCRRARSIDSSQYTSSKVVDCENPNQMLDHH